MIQWIPDSASHTITQWVVIWGDGTSDTLTSPDSMSVDTHIYQSPGDYLIQAVATAPDGNSPAMLNNDVAPASEWSILSPLPPGEGQGEGGAVTSLAVQPDGSIVTVQSGIGLQPVLTRFTSSGQADGTTFDDVSASIATITSVAVQSVPGGFDILAAGSGYSVARFNSDGSLDTTFGNAGIAAPSSALATGTAGVGGVGENPQMFVEPDGNIVLAGLEPDTGGGGADDLVLAEFQANGQPDDSFGTSGIKTYDLSAAASSCDAAYQPGGDIVAVVGLSAGSGSTEVLAFTSTGSLVSGFTGSGSFTTTAIKTDPLVAIQPNGSIDVAGGNGSDFAVVQYTANGGTGWTHSSAGTGSVGALAVQPGGRIVAAVDDVIGSTHAWSLYGFTASGSADSTFDGLGAISALTGSAAALAIGPNGDILLAGQGASDAFFAQYSAGGPAVAVSEPDVAPTDLTVTASPATYSGADTEDGGSASPAEIEGSFTDPGSVQEAHNVTIDFGDGTEAAPDTTTFTLPAGQTTFDYPLPQYAVSGEYTVHVSVADADGSNATSHVSVDVYYGNTQPSGLTLALDETTVTLGDAVNLSGSFTDLQSSIAHTVTIVWNTGGESVDITTLSLAAGESTFQASPQTYTAANTYTISVTVSGLDGTTATATTSVTVNPAPEQVMIAASVPSVWEYGGQDGGFVVTRTGDTSESLTVNFKVTGTAIPGTDYDSLGVTADFAAYQTTCSIDVSPTGYGNGDSVVVTLLPGSGYSTATGFSTAKVTIEANSTASGSGAVSASMSFFAADGTAEATDDMALISDVIPMGIRLVSGNTSGKTYTINYNSSLITVSDSSGVVTSGSDITLSTAYTVYQIAAKNPTGDVPFTDLIQVLQSGWSAETVTLCSLDDNRGALKMMMNDLATPINTTPASVEVGQSITLKIVRVGVNSTGGATTTDVKGGITWTVPGSNPVTEGPAGALHTSPGDYEYEFNYGNNKDDQITNYDRTKGYYTNDNFKLHWVDKGGNQGAEVQADVVDAQGQKDPPCLGKFTVAVPTSVNAVAKFFTGGPANNGVTIVQEAGYDNLQFGDPGANNPGVDFNESTAVLGQGWQYTIGQVVTTDANVVAPPGSAKPFDTPGTYQMDPSKGLDNKFPGNLYDSPAVPIIKGGTSSCTFDFTSWFGFEPVSPTTGKTDGDWVPIAELTWQVFISGTWNKNDPAPTITVNNAKPTYKVVTQAGAIAQPGKNGMYSFIATTEFPQWGAVVLTRTPMKLRTGP